MTDTLYRRIAYPTALRAEAESAFCHAVRLAQAAEAQLDLLHVDTEAGLMTVGQFPDPRKTLEQWGLGAPPIWGANGDRGLRTIAAYGKEPVRPVLDYMDESLPDLLVMATQRREGLDRWLHKSIAAKLARSRSASTLFVPFGEEGFVSPSTGQASLRRILIPVDWSPAPQAAIEGAAEMARLLGADDVRITLLYVGADEHDMPSIDVPAAGRHWTWEAECREGDVVEVILERARELDADLLVMTTKGHDGFLDALRGSTTERVLHGAPCPLLAVPAIEPDL